MNNRVLLKYHSFLGLLSGVYLLIIGLTGAILAFNKDIDLAEFQKYDMEGSPGTLALDKAIETVQAEFPLWETRIVYFRVGERIIFELRRPEAKRFVFVHSDTGGIIANIDANTTISKWLLQLHYSLHAGVFGRILLFVMGIIYLLSLLTGILLYRKMLLKTLCFKVRINRGRRGNFYSALHRYIGVWALILNLVLVVSGIFLAYKVAKAGLQDPKEPTSPKLDISVERSLEGIEANYPEFTPTYIRLPKKEDSPLVISGVFDQDPFYFSEHYNKILIEPKTGTVTSVIKVSEASLSTKLDSMITPLHYGQYGGVLIKLLYCFIGLSGPFLSVTGFLIWNKKRRRSNP